MDYRKITDAYYAKWLGVEVMPDLKAGEVKFVYSPERNYKQYGYSVIFEIWGLWFGNCGIISYGDKAKAYVKAMINNTYYSLAELCQELQEKSGNQVNMGIKYIYEGTERKAEKARLMKEDDFEAFAQFFAPDSKEDDWLCEYYADMVARKQCCGVFVDGRVVSCTDAPGMPYMEDMVQEIGINTLEAYRGKGYATDVCLLAIEQCIQQGRCPMWSTSSSNTASQRLAAAVGFQKYADCIMISEK